MNTLTTREQPRAFDNHPVARVNVDDETVEVFLPESTRWRVVVATLDGHGRPTTVSHWDRGSRRFDVPRVTR